MRGWGRWVALACAWLWVTSCDGGGSSPDGSTNWLYPCNATAECRGGLQCLCAVCTKPCDTTVDCRDLGSEAVCDPARRRGDQCVLTSAGLCLRPSRPSVDAGPDASLPDPTDASGPADGGADTARSVDAGITDAAPSRDASSFDAAEAAAPGVPTPVAASAGNWGWQGSQRKLRLPDGSVCDARIAIAVSDNSACFENAQDHLACTGTIGGHVYGSAFSPAGVDHADQVLISPSSDAIYVHTTGGSGMVMGVSGGNDWGQYGIGTIGASADTFTPWGSETHLVAFGTGTWDQICALNDVGVVYCAGDKFGPTPVPYGGGSSGHSKFWIAANGYLLVDDDSLYRAGEGRTECEVTAKGLECSGPDTFGAAGQVVMGGGTGKSVCWLESSGGVYCSEWNWGAAEQPKEISVFSDRVALALAVPVYADTICAVFTDASVACATVDITAGTATLGAHAPAGSALLGCGTPSAGYPDIAQTGVLVERVPVPPPPEPDAQVISTVAVADGGASVSITAFPVQRKSGPNGILEGPDGNLWFDSDKTGTLSHITPSGVVTGVPTPDATVVSIAVGPDGQVWFGGQALSQYGVVLGSSTMTGVVTTHEYLGPNDGETAGPLAIDAAGGAWFGGFYGDYFLGHRSPDGTLTHFYTFQTTGRLAGITATPTGTVWFTEGDTTMHRVSPSLERTPYSFPTPDSFVRTGGLITGKDGNVWFFLDARPYSYAPGTESICSITDAGAVTCYDSSPDFRPQALAWGPDDALWYTANPLVGRTSSVIRMTTTGESQVFPLPWLLRDITAGPNNTLWLTAHDDARIIRITVGP